MKRIYFLTLLSLSLTLSNLVIGSSIRDDESIIFFPTNAYLNGSVWVIPIHGWIFEKEKDSFWRKMTINRLPAQLEVELDETSRPIYEERAQIFLVDNERGKKIDVDLFGKRTIMETSKANGHFFGIVHIERNRFSTKIKQNCVTFQAVTKDNDNRLFHGRAHLINPQGISIISDIDDTIKISNVKDKKELLKNTFLKKFVPVPGMVNLYRAWQQDGAVFHYLSASPWHLYPALSSFIVASGFPDGSYNLKNFRMKDKTFFNLFSSQEEYKKPVIENLLKQYPSRRFILVGDAGQEDPEIFAKVARSYPQQVYHIFIRDLNPHGTQSSRYKTTFRGIPKDQWTIFREGSDLSNFKIPRKQLQRKK